MLLREVQVTTGALETTIKTKYMERKWKCILVNTEKVDELHTIFEEMFFEEIDLAHINLFASKYNKLSMKKKNEYLDGMLARYKEYGEYGFITIAMQYLLRF